ncbi:hypothetical protein HHI36_013738 [Cryptolaemus montrouzieri]|uniref:Nose resistant-to-fluoxetine protein N-terminal domain-containing protein n=1 Tax=Cryptolaemus montrouzieri TaxID=559131 RepID=A0ABD2NI58_9CUCU
MVKIVCFLFSFIFVCGWTCAFNASETQNEKWSLGEQKIHLTPDFNETKQNDFPEYETVEIFELWKKFSVFSMQKSRHISINCSRGVERFIEGMGRNEIDSMKIFDATGKLPSGLLRGNVNQFGDFDECMSVDRARYCLAEIDLEPNWKFPYIQFKRLIHSHYAIRETFDDVKHRVPGFSMVRWGFCIPKECSARDLENALQERFGITSRIKPTMCQTRNEIIKDNADFGNKIAKYFFGFLILITLIATIKGQSEFLLQNKLGKIVDCFNLQNNWHSMKNIRESDQEVKVLHGIRFLSALALLVSHKTMALFYNPYINRTVMTANLGMRWSVIGRTAILYTDCFMLISGFLNASSLFKELERGKNMKFGEKLLTRIFR